MKAHPVKQAIEVAGSIAMIVTCGAVLWTFVGRTPRLASAAPGPLAPADVVVDMPATRSQVLGSASAPVVIFEFSEFECPYCARSSESVQPIVVREYIETGKAQWVFQHYPLERSHPNAFRAAEAAGCAGQQGRFWEMHDRLFAATRSLNEKAYFEQAASLRLEPKAFETCMAGPMSAVVRGDMALAHRLGVVGTPTFFIGVREVSGRVRLTAKITGAVPVEIFREALNGVLAKSESSRSAPPVTTAGGGR
jgi:protein-disulfide isomerase